MKVRKWKSESNYEVFSTIFSLTFIGIHLRKYRSNTKFSDSEWYVVTNIFQYFSSAILQNDLFKWVFLKYVYNLFCFCVYFLFLFLVKKLMILLFKISLYLLSVNQVFLFNAIILCLKRHLEFSEPLVGLYVTYGVLLLVNRNVFDIWQEILSFFFVSLCSYKSKNGKNTYF